MQFFLGAAQATAAAKYLPEVHIFHAAAPRNSDIVQFFNYIQ
jgi:hypothetical protein